MKTSLKTALIAVALTAAVAGPAAANLSGQPIDGAIRSAISSGNVHVNVKDGVATLSGWVEDAGAEQAAKRAALAFDHVDSIVDLITVSN